MKWLLSLSIVFYIFPVLTQVMAGDLLNIDFRKFEELPPLDFERDSPAIYTNQSGYLTIAAPNEPRFNYDSVTGESLGLLIEGERTNLFTLHNANPTPLDIHSFDLKCTDNSTPVSVACPNEITFSIGFDDNLAGAGLDQIVSSQKVFILNNPTLYSVALTSNDTAARLVMNKTYSLSVYARIEGDKSARLTTSGAQVPKTVIQSNTYGRYTLDGILTDSNRNFRMSVYANTTLYFILPQVELGDQASSVIITNGDINGAVRAKERVRISDVIPNLGEGTLRIEARLNGDNSENTTDRYFAYMYGANDSKHRHSLRINTSNKMRVQFRDINANESNTSHQYAPSKKLVKLAYSYDYQGASIAINGDVQSVTWPPIIDATTTNGKLRIGATAGGSKAVFGHIQRLALSSLRERPEVLADATSIRSYNVLFAGQSLATQHFTYQGRARMTGSQKLSSVLRNQLGVDIANAHNGASGGSYADCVSARGNSKPSKHTNCWWDPVSMQPGGAMTKALSEMDRLINDGETLDGIIWSQGEAESWSIADLAGGLLYDDELNKISAEQYRRDLKMIFTYLRNYWFDNGGHTHSADAIPVFIHGLGRRTKHHVKSSLPPSAQEVRDIQFILEQDPDLEPLRVAAVGFDQPLSDWVHLTGTGYCVVASRLATFITDHSVSQNAAAGPVLEQAAWLDSSTLVINVTPNGAGDITRLQNCSHNTLSVGTESLMSACGFRILNKAGSTLNVIDHVSLNNLNNRLTIHLSEPLGDNLNDIDVAYAYNAMMELQDLEKAEEPADDTGSLFFQNNSKVSNHGCIPLGETLPHSGQPLLPAYFVGEGGIFTSNWMR